MAKPKKVVKETSYDRPKYNLREIQENKKREAEQRAKVVAKLGEAGIDMRHYWFDEKKFDELEPMEFFSEPHKQRVPLPYPNSEIERFWKMPKKFKTVMVRFLLYQTKISF